MPHALGWWLCLTPATILLPVSGVRAPACEISVATARTVVHSARSLPDAD
jgi:hypothetical protein